MTRRRLSHVDENQALGQPEVRARQSGHAAAGERGSISLFFVIAAVALFLTIGLVVDGGGKIRAMQRADAVAAEAARQGGQAIQAGRAIRGEGVEVDSAAAAAAARTYLRSAEVTGDVKVITGTRLEVNTTTTYQPVFLGIIGIGPLTVHGHAEVRLIRGLEGEIR
jgi:Flp pilus assembly protein TadG